MHVAAKDAVLMVDIIRVLVTNGANIHAEASDGRTPLSIVTDPTLRAGMVFQIRRPFLLFFEAVSVAKHLAISRSLRRVAQNLDLVKKIVEYVL